ncbi:hypothetical protein HaLaN_24979 [Haematococcus lacustris]|uniref:Uncharacterized protein n=1 Tax=Haematococcus lacustris TaxID=44745 RepID=A0A6A0A4Y2_HAELA|nr:hypothetical protein HaLaN_24979 [Haematococcus lacustris]
MLINLTVQGRVRHCKAGRNWQPVRAFVGNLQKAVVCLPSPFLPERAKSCPLNLLDQTAYHPSCFSNDLFTAGAVQGPSAFDVAMKRWSTSYLQQCVHNHIVAIDETQRDAFVYFAVDLLSKGRANTFPHCFFNAFVSCVTHAAVFALAFCTPYILSKSIWMT